MKETMRYLIAAALFLTLVGVGIVLTLVFGMMVWVVILASIGVLLLSAVMIAEIEEHVVEPIGKWWFHRHGRRWDL